MKKKSVLVLSLVLVCCMVFMAGCNKNGDTNTDNASLEGTTWVVSGGKQGDIEVNKEQLDAVLGAEISYTFEAEGKLVANVGDASAEGTWSQDGNTITISADGQDTTLTKDGDALTMVQGDITVNFTKK